MKIIVVGAGIYGLSTAVQLSLRGHEVDVIDKGLIPNSHSSSFDFHRLIRHAYGPQQGYASLIPPAFEAWDRMWSLLGESFYIETGALVLGKKNDPWMTNSRSSLQSLNVPFEDWNTSQLRSRLPWLRVFPNEEALFCIPGGIIRSGLVVTALAKYLEQHGVRLHENIDIVKIDESTASLTDRDGNIFSADRIVTALGAGHDVLYSSEVTSFRQVYALYPNPPKVASIEGGCPMILDIAEDAGFYFVPGSTHFPAKVGDHITRFKGSPYAGRKIAPEEIENLQSVINSRVLTEDADSAGPLSKTKALPKYGLCYYACSKDRTIQLASKGKSIRIFGGSGHGFKFGALFGEMVAQCVTGERSLSSAQNIVQGKALP